MLRLRANHFDRVSHFIVRDPGVLCRGISFVILLVILIITKDHTVLLNHFAVIQCSIHKPAFHPLQMLFVISDIRKEDKRSFFTFGYMRRHIIVHRKHGTCQEESRFLDTAAPCNRLVDLLYFLF